MRSNPCRHKCWIHTVASTYRGKSEISELGIGHISKFPSCYAFNCHHSPALLDSSCRMYASWISPTSVLFSIILPLRAIYPHCSSQPLITLLRLRLNIIPFIQNFEWYLLFPGDMFLELTSLHNHMYHRAYHESHTGCLHAHPRTYD